MQKTILLILSFISLIGCSNESKQNNGNLRQYNTETIKSKLSVPYTTFSEGYRSLDAEMISNSYTKDALLINVYNDAEPKSFKGRKSIYNFFSENLERAKKESLNIRITFKILHRQILDEGILDNGYYKLEISSPNQDINERYGKFSIVLTQKLDEWKFSVDTNASSTKKEYEEAILIENQVLKE
ncbi:hypothetical protein [Aquimarina sp. AU474]|uniref:hypothetical protein n=1 Tax=Aquimarina sp. AU474 TaxID=2108529 RepID=UPI000D69C0B4|nr:hypothetical protein [Aquimarina sp. AU474]